MGNRARQEKSHERIFKSYTLSQVLACNIGQCYILRKKKTGNNTPREPYVVYPPLHRNKSHSRTEQYVSSEIIRCSNGNRSCLCHEGHVQRSLSLPHRGYKEKESIQISVALNTQELQYCRPLCVKDGLKTYGGYDGQI